MNQLYSSTAHLNPLEESLVALAASGLEDFLSKHPHFRESRSVLSSTEKTPANKLAYLEVFLNKIWPSGCGVVLGKRDFETMAAKVVKAWQSPSPGQAHPLAYSENSQIYVATPIAGQPPDGKGRRVMAKGNITAPTSWNHDFDIVFPTKTSTRYPRMIICMLLPLFGIESLLHLHNSAHHTQRFGQSPLTFAAESPADRLLQWLSEIADSNAFGIGGGYGLSGISLPAAMYNHSDTPNAKVVPTNDGLKIEPIGHHHAHSEINIGYSDLPSSEGAFAAVNMQNYREKMYKRYGIPYQS